MLKHNNKQLAIQVLNGMTAIESDHKKDFQKNSSKLQETLAKLRIMNQKHQATPVLALRTPIANLQSTDKTPSGFCNEPNHTQVFV